MIGTYSRRGMMLPATLGYCGVFGMGVAGVVAADKWGAEESWANLLIVSYYVLTVGLGAAVLLALFWVTGARWCAVIRSPVEKLIVLLPAGAAGVALVLLARPSLYPWTSVQPPSQAGSTFQAVWLTRPFFLARSAVYIFLWLFLANALVRVSRKRDDGDSRSLGDKRVRVSAAFLVVFVLSFWLASSDWIMSLEPKWSSAVFGVYQFSGMFVGALAAVIVSTIVLDWRGALGAKLTRSQLRDLGTLLFAFSSFWMYIWFSQYMLIWYVNNPEETQYYSIRLREAWQAFFIANLVLGWGVPFVVLLFRPAKECAPVLFLMAIVVLAGRWLDLYLMIVPPIAGSAPALGH
jgi:hypothetical protein